MSYVNFAPGDYRVGSVLAVPVMTDQAGIVVHKGIIADGTGWDGWPTVLHRSKMFGMGLETTMTDFASRCVGPVQSEGYPSTLPNWLVLQRARQQLNSRWSLATNCEHFVAWAHGFQPNSPQLQAGVVKTAAVAGLGILALAILL